MICLIYFAENYPTDFEEMVSVTRDKENLMWLTAISSINVTHGLMIYFYMNPGEVAGSQAKIRADRIQFKRFCKLNSFSKKTFFILHCFALRHTYISWMDLIKRNGED